MQHPELQLHLLGRCVWATGCQTPWRRRSGREASRSRRPGWPGYCWASPGEQTQQDQLRVWLFQWYEESHPLIIFFLHQHSNFLLGQYGSNGRRGSHFFLLFWTGSVICRSRCRLLKLNQLYWTLIKYSCHFYAAKISMTTTELLSMNRRVRSAFIGKRSTQKQCWWAWNLSRKAISTHCTLL